MLSIIFCIFTLVEQNIKRRQLITNLYQNFFHESIILYTVSWSVLCGKHRLCSGRKPHD